MARKRKQKTGFKSEWTIPEAQKIVNDMIIDVETNERISTILSVTVRADINRDILCDWEKKFVDEPELLRSIKKLRDILEARLVENALFNDTNPGFTKFLLQSKFGYQVEQGNVTIIKGDKINISFDDDNEEEENIKEDI